MGIEAEAAEPATLYKLNILCAFLWSDVWRTAISMSHVSILCPAFVLLCKQGLVIEVFSILSFILPLVVLYFV